MGIIHPDAFRQVGLLNCFFFLWGNFTGSRNLRMVAGALRQIDHIVDGTRAGKAHVHRHRLMGDVTESGRTVGKAGHTDCQPGPLQLQRGLALLIPPADVADKPLVNVIGLQIVPAPGQRTGNLIQNAGLSGNHVELELHIAAPDIPVRVSLEPLQGDHEFVLQMVVQILQLGEIRGVAVVEQRVDGL